MTPLLRLAWLLSFGCGLSAAVSAAPAASARPVQGFLLRLHEAPLHAEAREYALASHAPSLASTRLDSRWQAVRAATGLDRLPGWRLQAMGAASHLLLPPQALSPAEARRWQAALAARPEVAWILPDEREQRLQADPVVPDDPLFAGPGQQWWLQPVSGSNALPIEARLRGVPGFQSAWARTTGRADGIVAVLDTGVRPHPDLPVGRLLPGYDFVSDWDSATGRGYANDGNGRDSDPTDPGDWVDAADRASDPARYGDCSLAASSWHGTAVAGLIAATADNGLGGAGIDWATRILPVRVAGKCGASVRDIIDGMRWAAGLAVCQSWHNTLDASAGCARWAPLNPHPARVINISFGGSAACHAEYQATVDELWARGVVVVAAAGNDHAGPSRPASCQQVIGVAALNRDGFKASYSNFGAALRIATVGGDDASGQWGALLADHGLPGLGLSGATSLASPDHQRHVGTSFATPLVSGAISLMLAAHPGLSAAQVLQGLQVSARPHVGSGLIGACSSSNPGRCLCSASTCGAGVLDADQAVAYAQAQAASQAYVPPTWPTVWLDTPELVQAAALGPDREALASTPEPADEAATGGGATGLMAVFALLLASGALFSVPRRSAAARLPEQRRRR